MLNILQLLEIRGISLDGKKYKIHLATGSKENNPLDAYYAGRFKEWQEEQTQKNFECDYVLGLIYLKPNTWLFAGVYKINRVREGDVTKYKYQTDMQPNQDDIIGRVIVYFEKKFRASYVWGKTYGDKLDIIEIKAQKLAVEDFPGYNAVVIPYQKLRIIINDHIPSWKSALSNINGIYLIVDTATGKKYVGKADGSGGIWQRWSDYAANGHGGNKDLKAILSSNTPSYVNNFQYSILEIADTYANDDYLLVRESYWKTVLRTREHGYNSN